jgi:hypothetical protein
MQDIKPNESEAQIPKVYIVVIALIQGLALAYFYQGIENQMWPGTDLTWLTGLVTFFVSFPTLFLLIAGKHDFNAIIKTLLPFTLLISCLGAYTGYQQSAYPDLFSTYFVFSFVTLIACFKAIMYIKLQANQQAITYQSLFLASWRNAVIFAVSFLFTAIFFGILHLGAALFDLLGIELFTNLLREEWFWVPAITLAFSFAIHVFRKISHLADNISVILQTLMKFLLPILVLVSLGFLITLPFTGLDKLWETRSGSFLLLWLTALSLFFVNAIYHKGNENKPYQVLLHRFVLIGVLILPLFSVISAYGIFSRIGQYGFTPDRLWALSIWFILSCFTLSYAVGILKYRDNWLLAQSKINVVMGLVVLAFVLLVSSPILNFKAISSNSQMARYYNGDITLQDIDFWYFSRNLGKPGFHAMQALKTEIADSDPEIVALINKQYRNLEKRTAQRKYNAKEELKEEVKIIYWPNEQTFNSELIVHLNDTQSHNRWMTTEFRLSIDLNEDGKVEYITILEYPQSAIADLWFKTDDGWDNTRIKIEVPKNKDLAYSFEHLEVELQEPEYKIINVGGITINVNANR